jgi:hypothetical protein
MGLGRAGKGISLVEGQRVRLLSLQEGDIDHCITIYGIKASIIAILPIISILQLLVVVGKSRVLRSM